MKGRILLVDADGTVERLHTTTGRGVNRSAAGTELLPMEEVERRHILWVLAAVEGNKTLAAQVLGIDRKTLYRKLDRYGHGAAPAMNHGGQPRGRARPAPGG